MGVICFRGRQRAAANHDAAHEEETGEGEEGIGRSINFHFACQVSLVTSATIRAQYGLAVAIAFNANTDGGNVRYSGHANTQHGEQKRVERATLPATNGLRVWVVGARAHGLQVSDSSRVFIQSEISPPRGAGEVAIAMPLPWR